MSKTKVLNIYERKSLNEGWQPSEAFNDNDIANIKDPSGMTDKKQITSIPSPFARIDLFKTAFRALADEAANHPEALEGSTIHHKLVSDCLDMVQLLFEYETFKDHIQILTWNREENLDELIDSENSGHRLLGETLKLFLEQDRETYNFDELQDIFLIEYDHSVIGGTSPVSMCFTSANEVSGINLGIGNTKFFSSDYTPLHEREKEFQKFLHLLFKAERDLRDGMRDMFQYTERSLKRLSQTDKKLANEIKKAQKNFDLNEFRKEYPVLNTGKSGETVYIIGVEMRKKYVNMDTIAEDSDFMIASDKWDTKYGSVEGKHKPLVLQNSYAKRRMKYVSGGYWKRNTPVSYQDPLPLEKRKLPGQQLTYPYLTVDDFLEPYLMKLVYPLNSKFFDGNMMGFRKNHVGFLLPLKKAYFEYFDIDDLEKTIFDGEPIIELSDRSGGGVMVTLRIPIARPNEYITFERLYHPGQNVRPEISEMDNKGAIMECQFSAAIFPFIKLADNNHYRVALVDRDIRSNTRDRDYNLNFYKTHNATEPIENTNKERSLKNRDEQTSKFYMLDTSFDFIEVNNGTAQGLLIPKFDNNPNNGTKRFTFAVDFGTTNSHIEVSVNGGEPEPFEIREEDIQFQTTYPADVDIVRAPELSQTILKELMPQIISKDSTYSFPLRTTVSQHEMLDHQKAVHTLVDINIPFYYGKMVEGNGTEIHKEIKWSNFGTEKAPRNRVEKFVENLLFIMRNKVIFNKGNLAQTELIWFYPSSMTPIQREGLEDIWSEAFAEYFKEVASPEDAVSKMSESLAPFHYFKQYERVDARAYPVASVDIGGGTTDVVVFQENRPKFISSFKFAGNSIYGDAYNSSPMYNGFVKKYKGTIRNLLNVNSLPDLTRVLEGLDKERSQEIISFFFSLDSHQDLLDEGIKIGFSGMLKDDEDLKIVFLVFYAVIFYHLAKLFKTAEMDLPRYICVSGNGSRCIDFLDSSRGKGRITKLAQIIFERVYDDEEFTFGAATQPSKLEIKQFASPKEVTCKGGIISNEKREIDDIRFVLLGTPADVVVNSSRVQKNKSERLKYDDLDRTIYKEVIKEVMAFYELFFDIDDDFSFSRNFGAKSARIDEYKEWLKEDLLQFLMQGLDEKTENDLGKNTKEKVEETLFFYPLVGALNNLASRTVD